MLVSTVTVVERCLVVPVVPCYAAFAVELLKTMFGVCSVLPRDGLVLGVRVSHGLTWQL